MKTKTITILATSDLHGKLFPWDCILRKEDTGGSVFQLSSAIKENRNSESTLLVDAGDTVQDLFAEIFLEEEIHPMMKALNEIGYDVWTTGNHEYDFGMDITRHIMEEFNGKAIVSNLYGPDGKRISEPYAIFEKNGVRIAVLCMVTPCIKMWDERHLKDYTVTNPIEETRGLLRELEGKYDVLLGVHHMGFKDENGVEGSGMESYLPCFPEYDAVIASHEHMLEEGREINGVLVVENASHARSMIRIDLDMERTEDGWKVKERHSKAISPEEYQPDEEMAEEYAYADQRIREYTDRRIGEMIHDGRLVKEEEIKGLPVPMVEPSELITLYNRISQYYGETEVSCASLLKRDINLDPDSVTICEAANLYPFPNTLCKVKMTGKQLRQLMEWSAGKYNPFRPGDLTISFVPGTFTFNVEIFSGVNYEVDISKEPGSRIQNLTWPDGTPVKDEEEFPFAMTNYRYGAACMSFGQVFSEEDGLPELIDSDVRSDLGGMRGLLIDYIENVLKGEYRPEKEDNWRIVGYAWDEKLHQQAVKLANEKKTESENFWHSITEEEVRSAYE